MICKKCCKGKHYKCKNGAWEIGTHCTCQHREVSRVTQEMIQAYHDAWHTTPQGAPGDRTRAGLEAVLALIEPGRVDIAVIFEDMFLCEQCNGWETHKEMTM